MYNYREAIKEDIFEALELSFEYLDSDLSKEDMLETLEDDMWTMDCVTGNGSGSYTFDREKAREYLRGNEELLVEAMENFGCLESKYDLIKALTEPEWGDVTIRCYLLNEVLWENADNIYNEYISYKKEDK